MWAEIEDGQVTRLIRGGLNVKVGEQLIGNLAILTVEERKELNVYKVVEPPPVDARYYAASYVKNVIVHESAEVRQENVISSQPVERIVRYRLEELREIRDAELKGTVNIRIQSGMEFRVALNDDLYQRLLMALPYFSDSNGNVIVPVGTPGTYPLEDVDGVMYKLARYEFEMLWICVAEHKEGCHTAYMEVREAVESFGDDDVDALIESDLEEMFKLRLDKYL